MFNRRKLRYLWAHSHTWYKHMYTCMHTCLHKCTYTQAHELSHESLCVSIETQWCLHKGSEGTVMCSRLWDSVACLPAFFTSNLSNQSGGRGSDKGLWLRNWPNNQSLNPSHPEAKSLPLGLVIHSVSVVCRLLQLSMRMGPFQNTNKTEEKSACEQWGWKKHLPEAQLQDEENKGERPN